MNPLKIGYLWHYEEADMSQVTSATLLHITAVVRGFERRGHEVRMVTFREERPHSSDTLHDWQAIELGMSQSLPFRLVERALRGVQSRLALPFLRFFDSVRYADACLSALRGYDVLYERYWLMGYGGLMAAKRLAIPLILELNGDLLDEYRQLEIELSKAQWKIIRLITKQLFERADHLVTVTEALRQRTLEQWQLSPAKVTAVPNGADVELFAKATASTEFRQEYQLNGGPIIMFVGSFKPWHGLNLLVDAFSHVAPSHPSAKLALVGDGPVRSEIEEQVKRLGLERQVIFTGRIEHKQVAALLSTADVAALSPRVSGTSISQSPLKLFEYMAAGKAVIAPDIPNLATLLTHGQNALLVPPNEPQSLAQAMNQLLTDETLRKKMGQLAQAQALEKHSWDHTVSQLEGLIYQLV
jgi:glycosyltransferase involved in cell wall biosynthesis